MSSYGSTKGAPNPDIAITMNEPIFAVTSDLDWASEFCVGQLLDALEARGIAPTVFATHASRVLQEREARKLAEIGLHPNFLPGSSHGDDIVSVVDHVRALAPDAVASRSHHFVDGTGVMRELAARGVKYDSNVCLYLQPGLVPLHHWTGVVRFPVFWEDDIHWLRGGEWDFGRYEEVFFTPGLKVINVHPFMFALNIPDAEFYERVKPHIPALDAAREEELAYPGRGTRTFVCDMIERVRARGFRFQTLSGVYAECSAGGP